MTALTLLENHLVEHFGEHLQYHFCDRHELTIAVSKDNLIELCLALRDKPLFQFEQLIDVTVVDYLSYGQSEWVTDDATSEGFDRAVEQNPEIQAIPAMEKRFAVVYHLLSVSLNQRLRIKVFLDETELCISSVCDIWSAANWFEREAFDLFGILFDGHPDLRRILTDYGFIGHPFRKDFPMIGEVEMRYDASLKRVVYEPVSIEPRILVPKVIRDDNRYRVAEKQDEKNV